MLKLMCTINNDYDSCMIMDTDTFKVERCTIEYIQHLLMIGTEIQGLHLDKNYHIVRSKAESSIIFADDKFAFLNTSDPKDYDSYAIQIYAKGAKKISFNFNYNIWVVKNLETVTVAITKPFEDLYEITFSGKGVEFILCFENIRGHIKLVYSDKVGLVHRDKPLRIYESKNEYHFGRV